MKKVRFIQPYADGQKVYIPSAVEEFEDVVADKLVADKVAVFPAVEKQVKKTEKSAGKK